jgi:hypothetical protein
MPIRGTGPGLGADKLSALLQPSLFLSHTLFTVLFLWYNRRMPDTVRM